MSCRFLDLSLLIFDILGMDIGSAGGPIVCILDQVCGDQSQIQIEAGEDADHS